MPNLNTFLDWHPTGNNEDWLAQFSRDPNFMIGHRGTSVVLYRSEVAQPAQDMLIVPLGQATSTSNATTEAGVAAKEELLIVGADNLNIARGDEFKYNTTSTRRNFRVTYVDKSVFNQVQARCEVIQ